MHSLEAALSTVFAALCYKIFTEYICCNHFGVLGRGYGFLKLSLGAQKGFEARQCSCGEEVIGLAPEQMRTQFFLFIFFILSFTLLFYILTTVTTTDVLFWAGKASRVSLTDTVNKQRRMLLISQTDWREMLIFQRNESEGKESSLWTAGKILDYFPWMVLWLL